MTLVSSYDAAPPGPPDAGLVEDLWDLAAELGCPPEEGPSPERLREAAAWLRRHWRRLGVRARPDRDGVAEELKLRAEALGVDLDPAAADGPAAAAEPAPAGPEDLTRLREDARMLAAGCGGEAAWDAAWLAAARGWWGTPGPWRGGASPRRTLEAFDPDAARELDRALGRRAEDLGLRA